MLYRAVLYGLDDFVCRTEHRTACKSCGHRSAAVYAGEFFVLIIAAKLKSLFNDGRKILFPADVNHFGIGYHRRGEYAVGIACLRRHKTVGREQYGSGNVGKLPLLILPCRAEISL